MPEQKMLTKIAGGLAITTAAGAVACGACCVLPCALPAAMLAGSGGLLALFAGALAWATYLAITTVMAAWLWIGWQSWRSGARPALLTLLVMGGATALTGIALMWARVEPVLIQSVLG